eukprot:TRINITY_DN741_c0_g2_i2.p1 TRINITY_DN741_c0_g2~~TRINITY_DN741_c0_g2_i2.p1  ORF type:complete len:570 (+),score=393.14 TRINITY_DN741_c0_g2_i2:56-1765(+)
MLRLLSLAFALLCVDAISFTGNVERDFDPSKQETLIARAITNDANFGPNGEASPDVGVPPAWPYPSRENPLSGWDIKDVRLAYNYQTDELHVGINCFEICGDADADGDANRASVELASRGGNDLADFSNSESIAFAFDVDSDGQMDYVLGYPSEQNDASERYPCADTLDVSCFGLYRYDQRPGTAVPSQRFVYRAGDAFAAVDHNAAVSAARPDLEWTVRGYNALREAHGLVPLASNGGTEWALNFVAFAGSFQDDGVGEDQLPNNAPFATAEFGCANVDACDICGGDDSTCLDCAGIPNGPNVYDVCDVCGGDGRSCADCAGVPHGLARVDSCGVCGGADACLAGLSADAAAAFKRRAAARYAEAGLAHSDRLGAAAVAVDGAADARLALEKRALLGDAPNLSVKDAVDCSGRLKREGGHLEYDACGVCGGDNECVGCDGRPFGAAYDSCGVCDGDNTTCCVNYCDVPNAYWNFMLLPVTLDNLLDQIELTRATLTALRDALPAADSVDADEIRLLQAGRMSEFNRVFLDECLVDFCAASGELYANLVADNTPANVIAAKRHMELASI